VFAGTTDAKVVSSLLQALLCSSSFLPTTIACPTHTRSPPVVAIAGSVSTRSQLFGVVLWSLPLVSCLLYFCHSNQALLTLNLHLLHF